MDTVGILGFTRALSKQQQQTTDNRRENTMKTILIYCDGGCSNNGQVNASSYASYRAFEVLMALPMNTLTASQEAKLTDLPDTALADLPTTHQPYVTELVHHTAPLHKAENDRQTNNTAEARAMQLAVQWLATVNYPYTAYLFSDSQLTVNQAAGIWKTRNKALKEIHGDIQHIGQKACRNGLNKIKLRWVPREYIVPVLGH